MDIPWAFWYFLFLNRIEAYKRGNKSFLGYFSCNLVKSSRHSSDLFIINNIKQWLKAMICCWLEDNLACTSVPFCNLMSFRRESNFSVPSLSVTMLFWHAAFTVTSAGFVCEFSKNTILNAYLLGKHLLIQFLSFFKVASLLLKVG